MESSQIIGYTASSVSIVAFGSQIIHTLQCGSVAGISLPRTFLDTVSLFLWVLYATRTEDIPLLIATSCELCMSLCITILILKHQCLRSPLKKVEKKVDVCVDVCVVYIQPPTEV